MNLAQRIELWPTDRLVPYERNARTHSDEQVAKIAASITEFGFVNPVLVDSADGIVAGHGRMAAARLLGLDQVPVIVLDHLTPSQRRAYVLADNRLALDAGWDVGMLASEINALEVDGFDLSVAGFSDEELTHFLGDGLLPDGMAGPPTPGPSAASAGPQTTTPGGIKYQEKYAILVECSGETEQQEIYGRLVELGYACKVLVN